LGAATVLERLQAYRAEFGDDFKPAALLETVAASGGKIGDV
jgi:hypothetical protein